jgi:hypothetical protein
VTTLKAFKEHVDDYVKRTNAPTFKIYEHYKPDDGVFNKNVLRYYEHCYTWNFNPVIETIVKCEKLDEEARKSRSSGDYLDTPEQFRDDVWEKKCLKFLDVK